MFKYECLRTFFTWARRRLGKQNNNNYYSIYTTVSNKNVVRSVRNSCVYRCAKSYYATSKVLNKPVYDFVLAIFAAAVLMNLLTHFGPLNVNLFLGNQSFDRNQNNLKQKYRV